MASSPATRTCWACRRSIASDPPHVEPTHGRLERPGETPPRAGFFFVRNALDEPRGACAILVARPWGWVSRGRPTQSGSPHQSEWGNINAEVLGVGSCVRGSCGAAVDRDGPEASRQQERGVRAATVRDGAGGLRCARAVRVRRRRGWRQRQVEPAAVDANDAFDAYHAYHAYNPAFK
jgi:hypothetical protein